MIGQRWVVSFHVSILLLCPSIQISNCQANSDLQQVVAQQLRELAQTDAKKLHAFTSAQGPDNSNVEMRMVGAG